MFDPDKWAGDIDRKLGERDKRDAASDAVLLAKRTLLDAKTKDLWNQLREKFRELCEAYNKRHLGTLHFDVVPNSELIVRRLKGGTAIIEGAYEDGLHRITVGIGPAKTIRVYQGQTINRGDGDVVLVDDKGPHSVEEIASSIMEEMLRQ